MKKFIPYVVIAIIFFVVGFGSGFEYQAYRIKSAFQQAFSNTNTTVNSTTSDTPTPATMMEAAKNEGMKPITKKIGDELTLDTGKMLVNSVSETQTLSSAYSSPVTATQGTKFVVVNLTVTNITNSSFTFSPDDVFKLTDNKKREFTTYSNSIGNVDNYLNERSLAPSVPETGVLVYQIPTDATGYSLVTSKASTKELYEILLK